MQSLDAANTHSSADLEFASLVVETVLTGMRTIRKEMRAHRPVDLTVPQFRVLLHLRHHRGAALTHLAEHAGLTLPSMSRAVDHLVRQGLVARATAADDRRRIKLELTEAGRLAFEAADSAVKVRIADLLAVLSPQERGDVLRGMRALKFAFERGRGESGMCCGSG